MGQLLLRLGDEVVDEGVVELPNRRQRAQRHSRRRLEPSVHSKGIGASNRATVS